MSNRSSLSGRLSRLRKDGLSPTSGPLEKFKTQGVAQRKEILSGWEEVFPSVWKRTVFRENILPAVFIKSLLLPENTRSENLIFYDTESTGLSTGAGTIPFLIGLGHLGKTSFEIIQYFLADYPGEHSMLEALIKDFPEDSLYVSYNGKSYDSHLINTRFLLNRISFSKREEVDLLYISRRLWKTKLTNCRLGTIEDMVLGISRGPDIPGAEIPDVWFDFLKNGNREKLELVFSHNLQDIHTLFILLNLIESIYADPDISVPFDRFSLGKILLFNKDERGVTLLLDEFEKGNRAAGQFLSLYYKRERRWDLALPLWKRMNNKGYNLFAVEELAKYYEHKSREPLKALSIVDKFLKSPLSPTGDIKERLLQRRKRLKGKIDIL